MTIFCHEILHCLSSGSKDFSSIETETLKKKKTSKKSISLELKTSPFTKNTFTRKTQAVTVIQTIPLDISRFQTL